jgi:hypothetical protein
VAVALGSEQAVPHPPQLVLVLVRVSQPSLSLVPPVQFAYPAAHELCGTTQPPEPLHETAAPDFRLASAVQLWPQVPQLVGSVFRSTHWLSHRSGAGLVQLEEQVGAPTVVEHSAFGATQRLPQAPQLAGKVRSTSQPSSPCVEQWAKPDAHALGGM